MNASSSNASPAVEGLIGTALGTSMTVKDLEASTAWFSDVMGFTVEQKYEREGKVGAVALTAGAVRVLINQDNGAKGWDRAKGVGFSLQIVTSQNIDDVATRIKNAGGVLDTEPADMPWGARVFALTDPDGFRWVISSPR